MISRERAGGQLTTDFGTPPATTRTGDSSAAKTLWILSFVFSAVALFLIPILFGPAAIVTGAVSWSKGSRTGRIATFVAILATVAGFVLSYAVYKARTS